MSKAVEASRCYFFENQECISKIYHLSILKLLSNEILLTYFYLSDPIHKVQFNVRYPVYYINQNGTLLFCLNSTWQGQF